MSSWLDGLLAFPVTPFTADLADVDHGALGAHVAALVGTGAAAVFVACGTGEFTGLSVAEHHAAVRTAVAAAAGAVPVFAGAGGGPRVAADFARSAAAAGADGILLLPPYLVRSTPAGFLQYVRYVAGRVAEPVLVYHRDTAVLDAAAAQALLGIDNVVGVKDGRGDLDLLQRLMVAVGTARHPRSATFAFVGGTPTAELAARAMRGLGVRGYSSAVLNFAPDIATAFFAALADDADLVQRLLATFYLPLAELRDRAPGYAVALIKAGVRAAGLAVGGVRPPLLDPTPDEVAQLAALVRAGRAVLAGRGGPPDRSAPDRSNPPARPPDSPSHR